MKKWFAILALIIGLCAQVSVVPAEPVNEKSPKFLPFLPLLLDDSLRVVGNPESINIEGSNQIVSCPCAVFDSNDNAHVVWNQGPDYQSDSVWANRYISATGWGTAATIETNSADIFGCPSVAADGNGNVVAVWSQSGVILLNRYQATSGWGTPETVGGSSGLYPSVAINDSGTLFVVWEDSRSIWARRYKPGDGWGTETMIETDTSYAYRPHVVVDDGGNATVVWQQQIIGLLFTATANHFSDGTGWGTPETISSSDTDTVSPITVDIDENGNVFAVWAQGLPETGAIWTVRANQFVPARGWGAPVLLDNDPTTTVAGIGLAVGPKYTVVVWSKSDRRTYAVMYTAASGWGAASVVANYGLYPIIAISQTGKVTVAWNGDDWQSPRAIQYTPGSGWGDMLLLSDSDSRNQGLTLAADNLGNFLASWTEGPGPLYYTVVTNRFQ